jgi:MFS family permease
MDSEADGVALGSSRPRRSVLALAVAASVALAFADSSIVVLALPQLLRELDTTVVGVSWVVTAFNLVVALCVLGLLLLGRRVRVSTITFAGLGLFLAASIACGVSQSLVQLIVFRGVQGLGAALLLVGSLPLLGRLSGSARQGLSLWVAAGTVGVSVGPALGGLLTEYFDWRAIFIAQAPVAGLALLAAVDSRARDIPVDAGSPPRREAMRANLGLLLLFGALVGAVFLAVLVLVAVWDLGPLAGAGVVSTLPAGGLLVRPLSALCVERLAIAAGAILLALGLVGLAVLPAASAVYAGLALAVCGAGLGLALPPLTRRSVDVGAGLTRSGTISIAARHVGLVVALVAIAPLLGYELDRGAERAALNATAVILDAPLPLGQKVPIVLDLRDEFEKTPAGEIPDLAGPFDRHGASEDPDVAAVRDNLLGTIEGALTRSFRSSFLLAALFALAALAPALAYRRRALG